MKILIKIVRNIKDKTYHPIFYRESPPPEGVNVDESVLCFKSIGHRTIGVTDRMEAIQTLKTEVIEKFPAGTTFLLEFSEEKDIIWDGAGTPADYQFIKIDGL